MRALNKRTSAPALAGWALIFMIATMPSRVFAASGAPTDAGKVLALLALIVAAYLLAHFAVGRLQRRFLVMSGVEYLILGILIGPAVPVIGVVDNLSAILPIIALAAGWIGLLRGTDYELSDIRGLHDDTMRVVVLHGVVPGVAVGTLSYFLFGSGLLGVWAEREALSCAAALGCFAASDSSAPVDLIHVRYRVQGELASLLRGATRVGDVGVVLVFGISVAFLHHVEGVNWMLDPSRPVAWSVYTILLGAFLGWLFMAFLGGDESENSRFIALVGVITFASGAAYFLAFSPLIVTLIVGMVLANFAPRTGRQVNRTLATAEKPIGILLYVAAGVLWSVPDVAFIAPQIFPGSERFWEQSPTLAVALVVAACSMFYVVLRLVSKWFASRLSAFGTAHRRDLYRGLLAHGDVTVAMLVSFKLVAASFKAEGTTGGELANLIYTVGLVSVVLHDLLAPRMLRALLADAGELDREQSAEAKTDSDADGESDAVVANV